MVRFAMLNRNVIPAGSIPDAAFSLVHIYILRTQKHVEGMMETQASISDWAHETFGPAGSNARVAARANEEMAELMRALTVDDSHPKAAEEVADIVIVLYRLATRLGVDLHSEVNRKMQVNRERQWNLDKTGHGYHVREKEQIDPGWECSDSPTGFCEYANGDYDCCDHCGEPSERQ